jgi:hypothetical protein
MKGKNIAADGGILKYPGIFTRWGGNSLTFTLLSLLLATASPASIPSTRDPVFVRVELIGREWQFSMDDDEALRQAIKEIDTALVEKKLSKGETKAIKSLRGILDRTLAAPRANRAALLNDAVEASTAINNRAITDFPPFIGILKGIQLFADAHRPAIRMAEDVKPGPARAALDLEGTPLDSRGGDAPPAHPAIVTDASPLTKYEEPGDNGAQLKLVVKYKGDEITLKWEETLEPAAAGLARKAGVRTPDRIYVVDDVRLKYDRKAFQNFSKRGKEHLKAGFGNERFGIALVNRLAYTDRDVFGINPEDNEPYIVAVLADGRELSGDQLEAHLLQKTAPGKRLPNLADSNFRPENEATISHLVLGRMNTEIKDDGSRLGVKLGPWSAAQLGHHQAAGYQATAVIAAWLANYDLKITNTAVYDFKGDLRFIIKDNGASFAVRTPFFQGVPASYEKMPWTFTEISRDGKRIVFDPKFAFIQSNAAGRNLSDAALKIAAANIGSLSEKDIRQEIAKAKLTPYEAELLALKLMSRRDKLIADLKKLGVRFTGQADKALLPNGIAGAQIRLEKFSTASN